MTLQYWLPIECTFWLIETKLGPNYDNDLRHLLWPDSDFPFFQKFNFYMNLTLGLWPVIINTGLKKWAILVMSRPVVCMVWSGLGGLRIFLWWVGLGWLRILFCWVGLGWVEIFYWTGWVWTFEKCLISHQSPKKRPNLIADNVKSSILSGKCRIDSNQSGMRFFLNGLGWVQIFFDGLGWVGKSWPMHTTDGNINGRAGHFSFPE